MPRRTGLAALAAIAVAAGSLELGAPAGATPPSLNCYAVDARLVRGTPVVACVGFRGGVIALSMSVDAGKSWTTRTPTVPPPTDRPVSVVVSSDYQTDHRVYVQYHSLGLYASDDGGQTLLLVDALGNSPNFDRATAFDHFGMASAASAAVLLPSGGSSAFTRGAHVPIAGSGNPTDHAFIEVGQGADGGLVNVSSMTDTHGADVLQLSGCTALAACTATQGLDPGLSLIDLAGSSGPGSNVAAVLVSDKKFVPRLYVGASTGQWKRQSSFELLVRNTITNFGAARARGLAVDATGRTFAVAVNSQIWVSSDHGVRWRAYNTPRSLRRLVFNGSALMGIDGANLLWCSNDRGVHWSSRC